MSFGFDSPQPVYVAPAPRPQYVSTPTPAPAPRRPPPMPPLRQVERPREPEVQVSLPGPDELGITIREAWGLPPPQDLGIDPR